jgi:hypothetical protein
LSAGLITLPQAIALNIGATFGRANCLQQHREDRPLHAADERRQGLVILVAIFAGFTRPVTAPQIL